MSAPRFDAAVAELYATHMVPMIFAPFATELAARVATLVPDGGRVIETACGTGVVTRALATALAGRAIAIEATDLAPAMLARAAAETTAAAITFRQADALALPFADASADVVACQFGAMFFPDRPRGFAEARRVLRPGGAFVFSVWDRVATSPHVATIDDVVRAAFPADPPSFLRAIPHGYHDRAQLRRDVEAAGFAPAAIAIATVAVVARAPSMRHAAVAVVQGTPMRDEIVRRDPDALARLTDRAEAALGERFGAGPLEAPIQAIVVTART